MLLVTSHSRSPPAATTVRSRPYSSSRNACGFADASVPFRGMRHSRSPRSPAIQTDPSAYAMPLGEASAVLHCATGLWKPPSSAWPSASGQP